MKMREKDSPWVYNYDVELRDLFLKLKPLLIKLFLGALVVGTVAGWVVTFLPSTFKASGLLFVTREADAVSPNFFTYEGYYAEQTAQQYTDSVVAILKSLPLKEAALKSIGAAATSIDVKRFNNNTLIQKSGPQIISVTVTAKTSEAASEEWQAVTKLATSQVSEINQSGDSKISVKILEKTPLLETVKISPILLGTGVFLGLLFAGLTLLSLRFYLSDK
ncbi:MAG: hypothetical protein NT141_02545 [candidate division WWE3 bacterium]|nr:hypothetical protein [candidate division WWE3 bacterium]